MKLLLRPHGASDGLGPVSLRKTLINCSQPRGTPAPTVPSLLQNIIEILGIGRMWKIMSKLARVKSTQGNVIKHIHNMSIYHIYIAATVLRLKSCQNWYFARIDDTTKRKQYHSMHDAEQWTLQLQKFSRKAPEILQNKYILLLMIITGLIFMGWINKFC